MPSEPIAPALVRILVAPRTHEPLRLGTADEVAAARRARAGSGADLPPFEAVVVTRSGDLAWPVVGGIPDLLADHALPLR